LAAKTSRRREIILATVMPNYLTTVRGAQKKWQLKGHSNEKILLNTGKPQIRTADMSKIFRIIPLKDMIY
jgi:hypothetical protein